MALISFGFVWHPHVHINHSAFGYSVAWEKAAVKFNSFTVQIFFHCWILKNANLCELLVLPCSWKLNILNGSSCYCSVSQNTPCNALCQQGCVGGLVCSSDADKLLHPCLRYSDNLWSDPLIRSEGSLPQYLWLPRPCRLGYHVIYV